MSKETDALIAYVKALVPGAVVSGVLGRYVSPQNPCSPHSATSMHCAEGTDGKGLAVDWGGNEANLLAVFHALEPVSSQMAELFHNAPGITRVVKNGLWYDGLKTLGATTWAAHKNHVHSAVHRGVFLTPAAVIPPPTRKVFPMFDPALVIEPVVADLSCPTGGAWCLSASGAIYAWGGAPHLGQPRDKDYFRGRVAARLEPVDNGYRVVAESGEIYGPGF